MKVRLGIVIALIGVAVLLGQPTAPQPSAASIQPTQSGDSSTPSLYQGRQLVHEADFGAWKYSAWIGKAGEGGWDDVVVAPGQIYATVLYSNTSDIATKAYIEANRKALPQVAAAGGEDEIYVVFNDYIPVVQFRSWAEAHKLRTGMSWLRAIAEAESPKHYIMIQANQHPDGKTIISDADVAEHMRITLQMNPSAVLKGVFATHAWVSSDELAKIAADPTVFYVDVTPNLVRHDLVAAHIASGAQSAVITAAPFIFRVVEKIDMSTPIPVASPTLPEPIDTPPPAKPGSPAIPGSIDTPQAP
jgi:hypothetical protein